MCTNYEHAGDDGFANLDDDGFADFEWLQDFYISQSFEIGIRIWIRNWQYLQEFLWILSKKYWMFIVG